METDDAIAVLQSIMTDDVFYLEMPKSGDDSAVAHKKEDLGFLLVQADHAKQDKKECFEINTSDKEDNIFHEEAINNDKYEKTSSSKIVECFQIGVRNSIRCLSSYPERDILMKDFMAVETTKFSYYDSTAKQCDFVFKTYAPFAFGYFRSLFAIQSEDFVSSFCGEPLLELPNSGASGSAFYVSQNDKFIVKTVQHKEALFLQKLLPGYYLNLNQNPDTLLPKFFGLYCYNCVSKSVRMVAMNNILPYSTTIHLKYDLKGSKFMRKASETERKGNCPTYKDLDFLDHHPDGLLLGHGDYVKLMNTLQRDVRVLESFQIMDYSLLLGITFVETSSKHSSKKPEPNEGLIDEDEENFSLQGDNENRVKKENITDPTKGEHQNIHFDTSTNLLKGIPAKLADGEDVLIYIGIIDILQSYRFKKKLEHVWKSILYDGNDISVHNPTFYAKRFQEFLSKSVFKTMPQSPKHEKRKLVNA